MSDELRLQRIEDREAIGDLLSQYCYLIASGDVDGVVALFTDDCRVEILGRHFEGEAGLRSLYADALAVQPKPYVHNHWIETLDGDSASGRAVFEIRQIRDGQPETGGGCYEDRYCKQDGVWRFEQRTFRTY